MQCARRPCDYACAEATDARFAVSSSWLRYRNRSHANAATCMHAWTMHALLILCMCPRTTNQITVRHPLRTHVIDISSSAEHCKLGAFTVSRWHTLILFSGAGAKAQPKESPHVSLTWDSTSSVAWRPNVQIRSKVLNPHVHGTHRSWGF